MRTARGVCGRKLSPITFLIFTLQMRRLRLRGTVTCSKSYTWSTFHPGSCSVTSRQLCPWFRCQGGLLATYGCPGKKILASVQRYVPTTPATCCRLINQLFKAIKIGLETKGLDRVLTSFCWVRKASYLTSLSLIFLFWGEEIRITLTMWADGPKWIIISLWQEGIQ